MKISLYEILLMLAFGTGGITFYLIGAAYNFCKELKLSSKKRKPTRTKKKAVKQKTVRRSKKRVSAQRQIMGKDTVLEGRNFAELQRKIEAYDNSIEVRSATALASTCNTKEKKIQADLGIFSYQGWNIRVQYHG